MTETAETGAPAQTGQGSAALLLPAPLEPAGLTPAQQGLRQMVIDAVAAPTSKAAYGHALDQLFRFAGGRPLSRALLHEWRSSMEGLAASTVNVRLSAVRRLVAEARHAGMLDSEEAARLTDVPNIRERGTRLGNWLTKEQAKALLAVPDRSTLKGKRDYAILGLLVGCALRRKELASLDTAKIQLRENRWVIADLRGKGGRIRTVAVPLWVKHAVNAWQGAAGIEDGPLLRSIRKGGQVGESLSDWAVWDIVGQGCA